MSSGTLSATTVAPISSRAKPALQDRRTPDPACPVLHPPARRKLLDAASVPADSWAYRATGVAPDLIAARTRSEGMTRGSRLGEGVLGAKPRSRPEQQTRH